MLVYTSVPLEEDLEVTGPVTMTLYASSSARDTDFAATLVDVHPDGRAINICEGLTRARFRESTEEPTLIEPGRVYAYTIDMWETSKPVSGRGTGCAWRCRAVIFRGSTGI